METNNKKSKTETGTIRGMVRRYSDQSFEFTPYGKGEPVYEEQQKYKNGVSVGKTRGAKSRQVVRIPIDGDVPDLFAACMQKLEEALPDAAATVADGRKARGTVLLETPGLHMVLNKKQGVITYGGTLHLALSPNFNHQFVKQFNELNQCLAINKTSILSAVHALQKSLSN
jgi:hypothetical protein